MGWKRRTLMRTAHAQAGHVRHDPAPNLGGLSHFWSPLFVGTARGLARLDRGNPRDQDMVGARLPHRTDRGETRFLQHRDVLVHGQAIAVAVA